MSIVSRLARPSTALALVSLLVLSACAGGGFDAKSKSIDELIATLEDASTGNPTDKNPTHDMNVVGGWNSGPRCDAAEELGKRKATAAVEALLAALLDGLVDSCAASALGQIGDARAVLPLLDAFERGVKLDESGKFDISGEGSNGADDLACDWYDPRPCLPRNDVVRALNQLGSAASDQVVPQLLDQAVATSWVTKEADCYDGEPNDTFRASHDPVACAGLARIGVAFSVLADLRDPSAEPSLVDWLKDPGREHASDAAEVRSFGLQPGDLIDHDPGMALLMLFGDDVDHLLPLLNSQETVDIAYAIVALGKAGTEGPLIDGLMRFGDVALAGHYLNCGNDQLEAAAHDWAAANGYTVGPRWPPTVTIGGGASAPSWGSFAAAP
jgi:hypothetical protein